MLTYIAEICNTEMGHHNLLQRLIKLTLNNPNCKSGYNFGMESVKAFIYTSSEWIQKCLMNNHELCEIMAHVNDNADILVHSDSMDIEDQMNVRVLLPPDKLPEPFDLERNPQLIKQRSEEWFKLRKKAVITASSAFNVLGLHTVKEQKEHHSVFLHNKEPKEHDHNTKAKIQHGVENEVSI